MPFFVWTDKLSVGVKASDDDHKQLFALLNQLFDGMKGGQGPEVVGPVLDKLVKYTQFHFAREEAFFAKTGFPAAEHKKQHDALVKQALELQSRHKSGERSLSIETPDFLKDWLTNHIQVTDQQYRQHLNAHGVH